MTKREAQQAELEEVARRLLAARPSCLRDIDQRGAQAQEDNWVSHFIEQAVAQLHIERGHWTDPWRKASPEERFQAVRAAVAILQA